jgi:hypothetical protein
MPLYILSNNLTTNHSTCIVRRICGTESAGGPPASLQEGRRWPAKASEILMGKRF